MFNQLTRFSFAQGLVFGFSVGTSYPTFVELIENKELFKNLNIIAPFFYCLMTGFRGLDAFRFLQGYLLGVVVGKTWADYMKEQIPESSLQASPGLR